jgi:hypothetical protein
LDASRTAAIGFHAAANLPSGDLMSRTNEEETGFMPTDEPQRRLYLHIGTEKTGTSTLQETCTSNRALLAKNGVCYPRAAGKRGHAGLTIYALDRAKRMGLRAAVGLQTEASVEEYKATLMERLRAEVARSDCTKILLSNEHMSSRLTRVRDVQKLVDGLYTVCPDIRVIVYLRPQYDLVLSSYSTAVKGGRSQGLNLDRDEGSHYYNFDLMLSLWEQVVGIENITVRLFNRNEFVGNSLISDFFDALGMEVPAGLEIPGTLNKAFDADTLQFARLVNELIPRSERKQNELRRSGILHALEQLSTGPKFTVAGSALSELDNTFRDSNERVARRYFPERNGVLFPHFNAMDTPDTLPLTPEKAIELAVALWRTGRKKKARVGAGRRRKQANAELEAG